MRFAALDHGAVPRLQGKPTEAIRFLIGELDDKLAALIHSATSAAEERA
jgi:hypothetical protein